MATPITRAEFEKLYGYKPKQETVDIETKPAPMPISRAEYEAIYKPKPSTMQSRLADVGTDVASTISQNIKGEGQFATQNPLQRGVQATAAGFSTVPRSALAMAPAPVRNTVEKVGELLNIGFQKVTGALAKTDLIKGAAGSTYVNGAGIEIYVPNDISNVENFLGTLSAGGEIANTILGTKGMVDTASVVSKAAPDPKTIVQNIRNSNRFTATQEQAVKNQAADILKVEEKYQKTRNENIRQGSAAEESRTRIAQSNVLEGAVDENGLIDTTEAVKVYRAKNIDGYEDVVKDILKNEAKTIDPRELRMDLRAGVLESGLEGATLLRALKGIDDHVRGLMVRSADGKTIPLSAVHDAKIGEYRGINWQTKPATRTYKTTIARVYKEVIENNSDADIKSINSELAKFYTDISRLEELNGKRVEGGRLGKYGAQVTGSVVGAGAGMVGGAPGAFVGGIVGGELASALKGKAMAQTFKRGVKGVTPENAVLKQAKLKVPDKIVVAPKNITKTPEIKKVEKQISTNVKLQKKAIKENNYTLVAELKDIYVALVEKLKLLVEDLKKNGPNIGLSIRKSVTPKSVAKRADAEDIQILARVLDDVSLSKTDANVKRVLSDMGLARATDDEIVRFAKDVIDERDGVASREVLQRDLNRNQAQDASAPTNAQNITDTVPQTIDNTTDLTTQAAKMKAEGKTLEEFVKGQGQVLYHGGTKIDEVGSMRSRWKAFYMSDDPTYAKSHGGSKSVLNEIVLSPNAKLADLRKPTEELVAQLDQMTKGRTTGKTFNIQKPDGSYIGVPEVVDAPNFGSYTQEQVIKGIRDGKAHFAEEPAIKDALKKLGYDGMITQESKFGANYGVWNKDVLKTRTQLEEIWNKAGGKTDPLVQTAQKMKAEGGLVAEARKYKSAEEFKQSLGKPYFHGARDKWTGEFKQPKEGEYLTEAIFVAPSETSAAYYNRGGGVKKVFIDPKAKLWDYKKDSTVLSGLKSDKQFVDYVEKNWNYTLDEAIDKIANGEYDWVQRPEVLSFLRKKGYDGFVNIDHGGGETIGVFSNKKVLTEEQIDKLFK